MGQGSSQVAKVEGTVAPGYESVKEMFQENFRYEVVITMLNCNVKCEVFVSVIIASLFGSNVIYTLNCLGNFPVSSV